jgi:CRP-like cAMP-binding protein
MPVLESRPNLALKSIDFLQGLKPQEVDLILASGKLRRFSRRCVMTHQGEPAGHLLLLWRGRARYFFETENGKKLNLRPITPGHIFGGAALVSGNSTYLLSSEALQDSVVLVWEGSKIRAFARRFHLLLENALSLALDLFTWYTSAYAALGSQTARERLAHVLVKLASAIGQKVQGGIELDLTNEELAHSANITPFRRVGLLANGGKLAPFTNGAGKSFCALLRDSFFASFEVGTHHHWPQHMCELKDFPKLNEQLASVHAFGPRSAAILALTLNPRLRRRR